MITSRAEDAQIGTVAGGGDRGGGDKNLPTHGVPRGVRRNLNNEGGIKRPKIQNTIRKKGISGRTMHIAGTIVGPKGEKGLREKWP